MTQLATTENLLHPTQVVELEETRARLQGNLDAPSYIRAQLADGGAATQHQIRQVNKVLEQAPVPYEAVEVDAAVKLESELREKWLNGMPTQAEMWRNVSGSVDKHRAWEKRSKTAVLKWKHVRRRLHASGMSDHGLADEGDISNVEMFRPVGGAGELNMHNAQLPGRMQFGPTPRSGTAVVLNETEIETLRLVNPELADTLPLLSNEQRQGIADILRMDKAPRKRRNPEDRVKPKDVPEKKKRGKMNLSDEERARRSERGKVTMAKFHADKRAAQVAAEV